MRPRQSIAVVAIVLWSAGCLVSLDESLWQNADNGPTNEVGNDSVPASEQPAADAADGGIETTPPPPDGSADVAPDTAWETGPPDGAPSDVPADVTSDVLPPDVTPPPPDIAPDQCVDQCPAGGTQCHTAQAMQTCVMTPNGCLAWGTPTSCAPNETCTADQCTPICTDQCNPGQRRCVDLTSSQRCLMTSEGCYDWATPEDCDWNERCFSGLCLLICSANGIPMPCDPLSAQGSGCFEGYCYLTGNGPACVCPAGTAPEAGPCATGIDCEPAHVCVPYPSGDNYCRAMCDPAQPSCAVGSCITIIDPWSDYGYCEP